MIEACLGSAAAWRGLLSGRVRSETSCAACGWRFERCPGHWVGGNEVNVVLSFAVGVATWLAGVAALGGLGLAPVVAATVATGAFSVAFYPRSRSVFFAIDYLIDPAPDPVGGPWFLDGGDDDDGRDGPDGPRAPDAPGPCRGVKVPSRVSGPRRPG